MALRLVARLHRISGPVVIPLTGARQFLQNLLGDSMNECQRKARYTEPRRTCIRLFRAGATTRYARSSLTHRRQSQRGQCSLGIRTNPPKAYGDSVLKHEVIAQLAEHVDLKAHHDVSDDRRSSTAVGT